MQKVYVYYSSMPEGIGERELYPKERMKEINECKNESVRREKYRVWELLEYAINDALSLDFNNLKFTKLPSGQWICDGVCFSLTHADSAIAVAVSNLDVGIDIEPLRELSPHLAERILTEREKAYYDGISDEEKAEFILECWCKKEAIFKSTYGEILIPRNIECEDHHTRALFLTIANREHLIAISAKQAFTVDIRNVENQY